MTTVQSKGAPSAPTEVPAGPTPRRVAIAASVGATIEWYDFFLYGTAAGLVFDKLYFNGLDGPAAQFAGFGTFAVGFLARPVGGLIFGHFGDRIGRKKMLLLTLLIMGVGTLGVVDFDVVCYGDPMYWLALTQVAILSDVGAAGQFYVDELIRLWNPSAFERANLALYSAIHAVEFLRWPVETPSSAASERRARLMHAARSWIAAAV